MPFLPDESTYIGECVDCKNYPDTLTKFPCYICDPIGGTNHWHHKNFKTYEEMNNAVYKNQR